MSMNEKEALIKKIDLALNEIRPHLAIDGGNVEIVDVTEENIVKIKWLGNCVNCSMSIMTLKGGLEQTIRSHIPQIQGVEAVN